MLQCSIKYCSRKRAKGRKICCTHYSRQWREKNPIRDAYNNLKSNAKRRKKVFDLTFEEFKEFAVKTEYLDKKGRSATGYHVDRIREEDGYTRDNIQVLTNSENIKKSLVYRRDSKGVPEDYKYLKVEISEPENEDLPF